MNEQVQPDDLDALMQRIRANVEARKASAEAQAIAPANAPAAAAPIDAGRQHYSAAEILAFYDVAFLRAAHLAILGREPDGEGASRLLQQLRLGDITRIDVIDTLRASDEAGVRSVRISGLGTARFVDTIRRSAITRKLAALVRISRNIPRLASYMRQVISRVDLAERKVQQLEGQLKEELAARVAAEARLLERIETLSGRIADIEGRSHAAGEKAGDR